MKKLMLLSATLALFFSVNLACAQEAPKTQQAQPSTEEIQEKLKAAVKAEFANVDANSDGAISLNEFIDYSTQEARIKAENAFNGFDTDNDGLLSEDEYMAALQNMMRKLAEQIKASVANQEAEAQQ